MEKKISKENRAEMLPRFEYLRSDNHESRSSSADTSSGSTSHQHKISVPFKRLNKRLSEILSEIQDRNDQVKGEIADFRLVFSDQSHEQTVLLQNFAKNFASIEQVCGEHSRDFSRQVKVHLMTLTSLCIRFSSTASPSLERLDHWAVTWQNTVNNKLARIIDQNSYDHQAASKDNKQLERLVLGVMDKCSAVAERDRHVMVGGDGRENKTDLPTEETDKSKSKAVLVSDESTEVGCEDTNLVESGVSKVFRVGSAQLNDGGRDFNIRYCDQQTGPGGWTVIQRRGEFGEARENFTRDWQDYKDGFGDLNGEFWFGNEFVHSLTTSRKMRLRVELQSHYGQTAWAEYEEFRWEML